MRTMVERHRGLYGTDRGVGDVGSGCLISGICKRWSIRLISTREGGREVGLPGSTDVTRTYGDV